jgi:membrane protein required for colicin V production
MTWVDIVLIIILCGLVLHGIVFGLIRGLFDIAGIILGYLLAVHYSSTLEMPHVLAFILIFVIVVVAVSLLGRIVSKLVHVTPLGILDRLLGGVLGLLKAVFVCFVFLLIVLQLHKADSIVHGSQIAPWILKGGVTASQILPRRWHQWIEQLALRRDIAHNDKPDHLPL